MSKNSHESRSKYNEKSYYSDVLTEMTPEYINYNFPVVGIKQFDTYLEVIRTSRLPSPCPKSSGDKRGTITHLSKKSMSRLACLGRQHSKMFKSLITLTYGEFWPTDGAVVKAHLNKVLSWLRRHYPHQEYLWFLEFQNRGAPHIHILYSLVPNDLDRANLALYWAGGVALKWDTELTPNTAKSSLQLYKKMLSVHFFEDTWAALEKVDGAARYVTKYATKTEQKEVPDRYQNVGRFWGSSSGVAFPDSEEIDPVREDELRDRLRVSWHRDMDGFSVLPKFIYLFDDPEGGG